MSATALKALDLETILQVEDMQLEAVSCPEWGGTVYLRSINGNQRDRFEEGYRAEEGVTKSLVGMRADLVSRCICSESGEFLEVSDSQRKALGRKSAAVLDRLFAVCMRLNGMSSDDEEMLAKNLKTTDENGSG